jgi:hypothetical protein
MQFGPKHGTAHRQQKFATFILFSGLRSATEHPIFYGEAPPSKMFIFVFQKSTFLSFMFEA